MQNEVGPHRDESCFERNPLLVDVGHSFRRCFYFFLNFNFAKAYHIYESDISLSGLEHRVTLMRNHVLNLQEMYPIHRYDRPR
ncbi:hypothetical protein PsorP6_016543 [Peronosclerospora sorghi]|uniref:Uncharacterized protein n=1 Tax=Peronosclerospora sorghi TaxID=230839 RepID=A0ACC0VKN0_9STRA|nr:hypothetical protein PsorP6_016543 [Peronosclerospora sorghi]